MPIQQLCTAAKKVAGPIVANVNMPQNSCMHVQPACCSITKCKSSCGCRGAWRQLSYVVCPCFSCNRDRADPTANASQTYRGSNLNIFPNFFFWRKRKYVEHTAKPQPNPPGDIVSMNKASLWWVFCQMTPATLCFCTPAIGVCVGSSSCFEIYCPCIPVGNPLHAFEFGCWWLWCLQLFA